MRLEISREVLAGIRAASVAAHPLEACGLLFGSDGLIDAFETTVNVADDPETGFEIDPAALFAALRAERAGGPAILGYWHSHPTGSVRPSARDLAAAQDDGKLWVIVAGDDIAAWRVQVSDLLAWNERSGDGTSIARASPTGRTTKSFMHVPLATGEVRHLVPRSKSDVDLVPLIAEAGYPAIAPILDDLLHWTADPNWPIAVPLIDYLATLGEPMVEPIRQVLRGDDDGHKFVCLRGLVRALPISARRMLRDELSELAATPCAGDWETSVDAEARAILAGLE